MSTSSTSVKPKPKAPARNVAGRVKRPAASIAAWAVLIAWGLFALVPIIWLLLAITKSEGQLSTLPPFSVGSLGHLTDSIGDLLNHRDGIVIDWFINSLVLTGGAILVSVGVTIPAAYALGTLKFRFRRPLLFISLALMLLPASALVLPLFLEMNFLGLIGERWAVILPQSVYPFGLYVVFIYFSTAIPKDIYDAARLDGSNEWQVFLHIALPLARPVIVLVGFFAFMRNWNEFVLPLLLLTDATYPLPVGLALLASSTPMLSAANPIGGVTVSMLLLATVLTMAPVVIGILFAHRSLIRGADALGGGIRG